MSYAELMGFKKKFGFYDGPTGMPCNLTIITLPGAIVTISLGAETHATIAAADGRAQFTVGTAGAWNVVAVKDDVTQVGTVIVENVVTKALALPAPLDSLSWTEIAAISRAGIAAQNFNIGDTKSIVLSTGEIILAQIIGFDHDDVADGSASTYGRSKAGITFQTKNVMNTTRRINASFVKWAQTEIHMSTLPAIKETMPAELVRNIVSVKKYTSDSAATSGWNLETTIDDLFLLSRGEFNIAEAHAGEGTPYEYYTAGRGAIKTNNSGTACQHWTRSPTAAGSYSYWAVINTSGSPTAIAQSSYQYIAPAFCV